MIMNLSALRKVSRIWRSVLLAFTLTLLVAGNLRSSAVGQSKPMPDGPGKAEVQKFCAQCHGLDQSLSLKQDRAGWQGTIGKMAAAGMKASTDELALLTEYLVRNYPADEVPLLNVNKAEALDFESALSLKRSQAAAIIAYREKNGPFKSLADLKKVPGIEAAKLEAKKDRMVFE